MKPSERWLIICCSLLFFVIHGPSYGQVSAEIPIEDTPQFHSQNHKRSHLLAHLADRMDLDGEGLRHIQKHLREVAGESDQSQDVEDVAAGDNAKGIFYFFKLHDYDDNQKLDGLEWMKALTDFHQEDNDKGEFKEGGRVFLEHEAEAIIDELLTKHDMDDDGMIDFIELMNSRVESFMTDLDKPVPGEDGNEQQLQQQQYVEEQSSLEQEFKQLQQGQQPSEHDEPQHESETQDTQQQEHSKQEPSSEEVQDNQEQQDNQWQHEPSLDDEYNQQHQQEDQRQEQKQQEHNPDELQGDREEHDNQQQHEPSLDDEYKQQQQQQEDQLQDQNQQEHNSVTTQDDQEQQHNQEQREPSLEEEYNQQQQQQHQ